MVSQKMKVPLRTPDKTGWSLAVESKFDDEAHLQDLIYKNPQIIPLEDINPEIENRKLFTIKELGLSCGNTDVVIIDDKGEIYLIETKLATNNEIRRKVVGQILEYAAYLWQQNFEFLDDKVRSKHGSGLSEQFQNVNGWIKEDFEDAVANNLMEGTFNLIIVVDKVNDELRRITKFTMEKGLAVYPVELRYFKDKGGIEVIVPTVFNVPQTKKTAQEAKDFTEEYHLNGKPNETVELYEALKDRIVSLGGNIKLRPRQLYIGFIANSNFVDVHIQKNKLKLWINMSKGELDDPKKLAKDVSEVGHWGNGDYEVLVNSSSDLDYLLTLIKQSYLKHS